MIKDTIIAAIQQKKCLNVFYDGGYRVIEPHCLGISSSGNINLRCWQRSGVSTSGEHSGWKLITISKIRSCELINDDFVPHIGYNPNDKGMTRIIARV